MILNNCQKTPLIKGANCRIKILVSKHFRNIRLVELFGSALQIHFSYIGTTESIIDNG